MAAIGSGSDRRWQLAGGNVRRRGGDSEGRWQRGSGSGAVVAARCGEAVAARGGGCDTVAASGNGAVAVRRWLARRWLARDGGSETVAARPEWSMAVLSS